MVQRVLRGRTFDGALSIGCGPRALERKLVQRGLPGSLRTVDQLNVPIQAGDPSEPFRSSDIESQLSIGFGVIERVQYGGAILIDISIPRRCIG